MIEKKLEDAIKLLVQYFPSADTLIKPTIFHSIRVGIYLYDNGYNEDICIGGILHDIIEDTEITEQIIEQTFGKNVLDIVKANTQNDNLPKEERKDDLIKRCTQSGENSLIVKCADVIDNYGYRSKQNRIDEIERCINLVNIIKKYKPESYKDKIFDKLFARINS